MQAIWPGRMRGFQSNDVSVSVAISPTMPRLGSEEQIFPVSVLEVVMRPCFTLQTSVAKSRVFSSAARSPVGHLMRISVSP